MPRKLGRPTDLPAAGLVTRADIADEIEHIIYWSDDFTSCVLALARLCERLRIHNEVAPYPRKNKVEPADKPMVLRHLVDRLDPVIVSISPDHSVTGQGYDDGASHGAPPDHPDYPSARPGQKRHACGNCGDLGHNRRTCPRKFPEP